MDLHASRCVAQAMPMWGKRRSIALTLFPTLPTHQIRVGDRIRALTPGANLTAILAVVGRQAARRSTGRFSLFGD